VTVLGTICGIESENGWYYEACSKCAASVKNVAGSTVQGVSKEGTHCRGDHMYLTNTTV
jgi:hypothetical protein